MRDLDEGEKHVIKKLKIKAYDMDDVTNLGIGKVMREVFSYFNKKGNIHPIHCSFDIDGIDPAFVVQTGTRCRGGLTDREAHYIMR